MLFVKVHVLFLRLFMRVHHDFRQVEKFLPETNGSCSTRGDGVVLRDFPCLLQHFVEVALDKLAISLIMYTDVHLIIYLPAPPVVIHRTKRHRLTVIQINF
jgi:hypothetical protein